MSDTALAAAASEPNGASHRFFSLGVAEVFHFFEIGGSYAYQRIDVPM
jgi:hypothetical protein